MSMADILTRLAEKIQSVFDVGMAKGIKHGIAQQQPIIDGYLADFAKINKAVDTIKDDTPTGEYAEQIKEEIYNNYQTGVGHGYSQGKQSAYDDFWNEYQQNGNRTDYARAFEGAFWNDERFKPKYSVGNAQNCNYMFRYTNIKDLSSLNIGYCTGAYALCREAALELMGNIYLAGNTSISQGFYSCSKLTKIGVLRVGAGTNLEHAFYNCTALKEVTFTGTIGTSLGIGDSPLNRASIDSIISCLSDTATGKTLTLKKTAVNEAFGINVDDQSTWAEGSEFYELRHSKDNWTFSYV